MKIISSKFKVVLSLLVVTQLGALSCVHKETPRVPASQTTLDDDDRNNMKAAVVGQDKNHLIPRFTNLKAAQNLTSSFDMQISKIKKDSDMDKLYQSELYCKIMKVRSIHEHVEDQVVYGLKVAKETGPEAVKWYYQQLSDYAKRGIPHEVAMIQIFRVFVDEEIGICGKENCVADDVKLLNFSINPMDNKAFKKLIVNNIGAIAEMGNNKANLAPGSCFNNDDKRKPQSAGFDWQNRNWIGSVLPQGQFVFTYDDGPHAVFTKKISDTWANSGLTKPAFFWLRKNVTALPEIVKDLNNQGYVIGSHSERHADLGTLAKANSAADLNSVNRSAFAADLKGMQPGDFAAFRDATLTREIDQSVKDLAQILGKPVRYFRLPYGSGTKNEVIGSHFTAMNLDHFFWRVDSLDWQDKNPESIRDRVTAQMNIVKKGIVLFHDVHQQSAQAAQLMVDYLKANPQYKAVSITDLPGLQP